MPVEFTEMIPNLIRQAYNVISVNFYPNRPASISMDLDPIRPVEFDWWNAFNRQCHLNVFTPNSTGRIGCKSIEIMTTKFDQAGIHSTRQAYNVISVNFYPNQPASISMDLDPIRLVECL